MQTQKTIIALVILVAILIVGSLFSSPHSTRLDAKKLVYDHARAWKTGDAELLDKLLHEDVIFAYPGRRLNKQETLDDLEYFRDNFADTEVYIHTIVVEGDDVAVEWQFATTDNATGERQVVSDAIIGKLKDGKWIVWKEYLDGRVKTLQADEQLSLEEGDEPFPWPLKTESYKK